MKFSPALLSSNRMDWRTPDIVLKRVRLVGSIALDPCTSLDNPCGAAEFYAPENGDDGLVLDWSSDGLTFANPPYGRALRPWVDKATHEAAKKREIVLLVPSRTDTRWWGHAFDSAQAVAFWAGRVTFVGAPSTAPFPTCLFYFGDRARRFKRAFADRARVIPGGRP